MDKRDYIISLYEIYKELLTDKQKDCFEYYYFEDLSLSEISENMSVSRAYVSKTVNTVVSKLEFFENNLEVYKTKEKIRKISKKVNDKNLKNELEKLL